LGRTLLAVAGRIIKTLRNRVDRYILGFIIE
jgi:hypothetical protein